MHLPFLFSLFCLASSTLNRAIPCPRFICTGNPSCSHCKQLLQVTLSTTLCGQGGHKQQTHLIPVWFPGHAEKAHAGLAATLPKHSPGLQNNFDVMEMQGNYLQVQFPSYIPPSWDVALIPERGRGIFSPPSLLLRKFDNTTGNIIALRSVASVLFVKYSEMLE